MKNILFYYLIVMNVIAYMNYLIDKRYAEKEKYRISESHLLLLALIGGPFGAHMSMAMNRHKTKHLKFLILVPLCEILWVILIYLYLTRIYFQ